MSGLPEGWAETSIAALGKWGSGGTPKSDNKSFYGGEIPWIRSGDLPDGPITKHEVSITPDGLANSSAKWVPEGSVLIAMYGATIGKLGVTTYPVTTNQAIAFCQPNDAISAQFLFHGLRNIKQDLIEMGQGGAQPNISQEILKAVPFALPPLPEQKRIVAKVDGLTARTARARADLARIPTLIARYKQRLLALAFSGELTAGWRVEAKLPAPQFMSIDSIAEGLRYGTAQKCYEEPKGIAVLRIPNVASGRISLDDLKYAELESKELAKLILREGDILIVRSNGSADLVGRPALVTGKAVGLAYAGYLIRVRPEQSLVSPKFLTLMLEAPNIRKVIEDGARSTSGVHNVNAKELGALQIPIFHLTEQTEITRRIESSFNWLDRMAADHAAAANLLPKLDAAILAKAFRGELVPQDPADEPASFLLKRISAERGQIPKKGRSTKQLGYAVTKELAHSVLDEVEPEPRTLEIYVTDNPLVPVFSAVRRLPMTKSRQDDDVMGKPYLANLLKAGRETTAQDLFKASDLPVADFYKQLAWEIAHKHIRDDDEKLEAL